MVSERKQITASRCIPGGCRGDGLVRVRGREAGRIEISSTTLGGYERMVEDGTFTWTKPFSEQGLWRWDAMFSAGVRAHYHASSSLQSPWSPARAG